jgi:hypothetical protein
MMAWASARSGWLVPGSAVRLMSIILPSIEHDAGMGAGERLGLDTQGRGADRNGCQPCGTATQGHRQGLAEVNDRFRGLAFLVCRRP